MEKKDADALKEIIEDMLSGLNRGEKQFVARLNTFNAKEYWEALQKHYEKGDKFSVLSKRFSAFYDEDKKTPLLYLFLYDTRHVPVLCYGNHYFKPTGKKGDKMAEHLFNKLKESKLPDQVKELIENYEKLNEILGVYTGGAPAENQKERIQVVLPTEEERRGKWVTPHDGSIRRPILSNIGDRGGNKGIVLISGHVPARVEDFGKDNEGIIIIDGGIFGKKNIGKNNTGTILLMDVIEGDTNSRNPENKGKIIENQRTIDRFISITTTKTGKRMTIFDSALNAYNIKTAAELKEAADNYSKLRKILEDIPARFVHLCDECWNRNKKESDQLTKSTVPDNAQKCENKIGKTGNTCGSEELIWKFKPKVEEQPPAQLPPPGGAQPPAQPVQEDKSREVIRVVAYDGDKFTEVDEADFEKQRKTTDKNKRRKALQKRLYLCEKKDAFLSRGQGVTIKLLVDSKEVKGKPAEGGKTYTITDNSLLSKPFEAKAVPDADTSYIEKSEAGAVKLNNKARTIFLPLYKRKLLLIPITNKITKADIKDVTSKITIQEKIQYLRANQLLEDGVNKFGVTIDNKDYGEAEIKDGLGLVYITEENLEKEVKVNSVEGTGLELFKCKQVTLSKKPKELDSRGTIGVIYVIVKSLQLELGKTYLFTESDPEMPKTIELLSKSKLNDAQYPWRVFFSGTGQANWTAKIDKATPDYFKIDPDQTNQNNVDTAKISLINRILAWDDQNNKKPDAEGVVFIYTPELSKLQLNNDEIIKKVTNGKDGWYEDLKGTKVTLVLFATKEVAEELTKKIADAVLINL